MSNLPPPGWGVPPPAGPPGYGPGPAPGWGPAPGPYGQPWPPARRQDGRAVAALVLGIVSIAVCSIVGYIPGIIAMVLGRKAQKAIDADPSLDGRGMATAGIATGAVGTALGVIIDVFYLLIIVLAIAAEDTSTYSLGAPPALLALLP